MTEITLHICWHMCRMFAGCNAAIVTTGTAASNFIVIHTRHGRPQRRAMARLTLGAGLDMRTVFASGGDAIVAGSTATGYGRMVNYCHR